MPCVSSLLRTSFAFGMWYKLILPHRRFFVVVFLYFTLILFLQLLKDISDLSLTFLAHRFVSTFFEENEVLTGVVVWIIKNFFHVHWFKVPFWLRRFPTTQESTNSKLLTIFFLKILLNTVIPSWIRISLKFVISYSLIIYLSSVLLLFKS